MISFYVLVSARLSEKWQSKNFVFVFGPVIICRLGGGVGAEDFEGDHTVFKKTEGGIGPN